MTAFDSSSRARISLVTFLGVASAGCFSFPVAQQPGSSNAAYAAYGASPTHAPATAAEWQQNEDDARRAVAAGGASEVLAPVRLAQQGAFIEHAVRLEGGYCYVFALAWRFGGAAMLSISFDQAPGAQPVNRSFSTRGGQLATSPGSYVVCADASGPANVSVSAITSSGTIASNELLEYALMMGRSRESQDAARARQAREANEARQLREQQAANIAQAQAREAAEQERAARDAERERMFPSHANDTSSSSSSYSGSLGASSGPRSVTVHSDCNRTLGLYRGGGQPPFGSGTYGSISSNSTESFSLGSGESLWIVDDARRPISSYSPSGGERVTITSSCSAFVR